MVSYVLPDLPYAHDALRPGVDEHTLRLHHGSHHAGYVERLNRVLAASEQLRALAEQPVEELLWHCGKVPDEYRNAVRNFGGGHANHSLFWTSLSPRGGGVPTGGLADALQEEFGSFATFQEVFTSVSIRHVGSGWAWLVLVRDRLIVYSLPNEDSPLTAEEIPLLGLDLWEHAYYLQYQDDRRAWVEAFWKLVDWNEVSRRFAAALRG